MDREQEAFSSSTEDAARQLMIEAWSIRVGIWYEMHTGGFGIIEPMDEPHTDEECAIYTGIKHRLRTDEALRVALFTIMNSQSGMYRTWLN
jgi:hypothetical protein